MGDLSLDMKTQNGTAYRLIGADNAADNAPVVVLIHGLGLCSSLWDEYLDMLSTRFRVLIYDLYGHGASSPASVPLNLSVFTDQIVDLLDALAIDRVHLVGFSIGGMIGRKFATLHSHRLHSLVVMNSPHIRDPDAQRAVESRALAVAGQGALATMEAALERWFSSAYRANNPAALDAVRNWRLCADAGSYAESAWVLADGVKEFGEKGNYQGDYPCLVMTCENDSGSTPAMSRAIVADFGEDIGGRAELRIIPDLRHLGLLERPDLFIAEIMRFLTKQ